MPCYHLLNIRRITICTVQSQARDDEGMYPRLSIHVMFSPARYPLDHIICNVQFQTRDDEGIYTKSSIQCYVHVHQMLEEEAMPTTLLGVS